MIKTLHLFIVSIGFVCAFILPGCDDKTNYFNQNTSSDVNYETYTFPTRNVSGFKELVTGDRSSNFEGFGNLYLPTNVSATNKVPLMIILHGSGGTWAGRGARHAEFLSQNGIGALVIDTFSSRGLSEKDKYIPRLMEANFPDQLADAFGALNALQGHPFVDGNNVGIMGQTDVTSSISLSSIINTQPILGATNRKKNGELNAGALVDLLPGITAWIKGAPIRDVEISLGGNPKSEGSTAKTCPRARELVGSIIPRGLSFIMGLITRVVAELEPYEVQDELSKELVQMLSTAVRLGYDTPQKTVFAINNPRILSRVQAHNAFNDRK